MRLTSIAINHAKHMSIDVLRKHLEIIVLEGSGGSRTQRDVCEQR